MYLTYGDSISETLEEAAQVTRYDAKRSKSACFLSSSFAHFVGATGFPPPCLVGAIGLRLGRFFPSWRWPTLGSAHAACPFDHIGQPFFVRAARRHHLR